MSSCNFALFKENYFKFADNFLEFVSKENFTSYSKEEIKEIRYMLQLIQLLFPEKSQQSTFLCDELLNLI
jgi:hypothetical protein